MNARMVITFALAGSLCGCATPYGSTGLTGGYSEKPLNEHLIQVYFSGNGFISADKVRTFALYRCAEVARNAKKPYFVLYDSLVAAAQNRPSSAASVGTLGGKPLAYAFIALEDEPHDGSHETSKVLAELKPVIDGVTDNGKANQ